MTAQQSRNRRARAATKRITRRLEIERDDRAAIREAQAELIACSTLTRPAPSSRDSACIADDPSYRPSG